MEVYPQEFFIIMSFGVAVVMAVAIYELILQRRHIDDLAEAHRRSAGLFIQDDLAGAQLKEKARAAKEALGNEHCLSPDYKFIETHRLNAEK
jgi:hypothetical protein